METDLRLAWLTLPARACMYMYKSRRLRTVSSTKEECTRVQDISVAGGFSQRVSVLSFFCARESLCERLSPSRS